MGVEAVCDELLEEKLSSLPATNFSKKGEKVKKWLKKCETNPPQSSSHKNFVPSQAPSSLCSKSEKTQSTWPPSTATPFYSQCRCDWSAASTQGTACCNHRGPCQHCIDNLADVATEVDDYFAGPPEKSKEHVAIKTEVDDYHEGPPEEYKEDVAIMCSKGHPDDGDNYIWQATQRAVAVANHVKFMDNSDTESDDEPYYEVNTFTPDGRIVHNTGIFQRESDAVPVSEDDFVVQRMTGDRLREYRAKHCGSSTPASREESRLRELDKMRRGYEMMFPGKPCITGNFGDMDIYLKRKIEILNIL